MEPSEISLWIISLCHGHGGLGDYIFFEIACVLGGPSKESIWAIFILEKNNPVHSKFGLFGAGCHGDWLNYETRD